MRFRVSGTRVFALAAVILVMSVAATAFTAANTIPATRLGQTAQTITADSLKPASCASVSLSTKVSGSGTFSGTSGANLLVGERPWTPSAASGATTAWLVARATTPSTAEPERMSASAERERTPSPTARPRSNSPWLLL